MKNLVMLGRQGSGKGTQAEILAERLGIPAISTGQLLRAEMEKETDLGQQISGYMKSGDLVPDELVMGVLLVRLDQPDVSHGFILDGFPRNLAQAELLDQRLSAVGHELSDVVHIELPDEAAVRRLSGRRVCTNTSCGTNYHLEFNPPQKDPERCDHCGSSLMQRDDDRPEAIQRRLALYDSNTAPLVGYYREKGLLREVDGEPGIDEVNQSIYEAIKSDSN